LKKFLAEFVAENENHSTTNFLKDLPVNFVFVRASLLWTKSAEEFLSVLAD
jgi:hypothetical protein